MHRSGGALRCGRGHSYDIAREGYANLLPGGAGSSTADTAEMVAARVAFLASGHFEPIADAVASAAAAVLAAGVPGCCVLEAGAGTGYYLARMLERAPGRAGLALDLSKHAARRSARAHPRIGAVVADTWARLPVRTGAAAVVLDVFAPRNGAEFSRVLAPGGALVVVTPTARHLRELVDALGLLTVDEDKESRTEESLSSDFVRVGSAPVEAEMLLDHEQAAALVAMGPSSRHVEHAELETLIAGLPQRTPVTLSVTVSTYHRHTPSAGS
jgi:23S rRNA (guanine745-N1)-methyltransferase